MREGWKYQKLGELVKVINGLWVGKKPPFTNVAVVRNANFTKSCTLDMSNIAYIDVEEKQFNTRELQYADIIIEKSGGSEKQPVGRPVFFNIKDRGYSFSNFTATLRVVSSDIVPEYLYKVLLAQYKQGVTKRLQSKTTGLHNLNFKSYLKSVIPIPPLSTQQSIVVELDKINELIRLKKEQLKDYDNLAQSIFYEMFGDPVVNEKGWDNSTLESVCSSIVRGPFGSALKKEFFVEPTNDTYKVYEQKHAIQKNHIIGSYYITKEKFHELRRFEVFPGDIIMSCSGTIGEFYQIPKEAEKGVMNQALLKFTLNENRTTTEFFMFLMNFIKNSFETKGTGLQNIGSVKVIKSTILGLPPLPLQQLFAQRIELIEKQKAEVQRTIKDLETLLASRMQYWFD